MTPSRSFSPGRLAIALLTMVLGSSAFAQTTPLLSPTSTDANVPPATAQKQAREMAQGDPARWFREDTSAAAALRRLQKEIGAALQEAQGACGQLPATGRSACMNDARATYTKEMAGAKARVMAEQQ